MPLRLRQNQNRPSPQTYLFPTSIYIFHLNFGQIRQIPHHFRRILKCRHIELAPGTSGVCPPQEPGWRPVCCLKFFAPRTASQRIPPSRLTSAPPMAILKIEYNLFFIFRRVVHNIIQLFPLIYSYVPLKNDSAADRVSE